MIRKPKKTRKKRGYEMHSGLRRRGAGNRGGRGQAGAGKKGKQKVSKRLTEGKRLGRYGFKNLAAKPVKAINLRDLAKHVKGNIVDVTELGYEKVLGKGEAMQGVTVKAKIFTNLAKTKIEKAKGKAIVM